MSKLWTAIKVANICFIIHLLLIVVGETVRATSTEWTCGELPSISCVYIVGGTRETFWSVARRFDVTPGALFVANPTVPLFWPLPVGTRILIPVNEPKDF